MTTGLWNRRFQGLFFSLPFQTFRFPSRVRLWYNSSTGFFQSRSTQHHIMPAGCVTIIKLISTSPGIAFQIGSYPYAACQGPIIPVTGVHYAQCNASGKRTERAYGLHDEPEVKNEKKSKIISTCKIHQVSKLY
jgi:hypothetical protein